MPYAPAADLTSKKLTMLVPSALVIPDDEAFDVLLSSVLVVAIMNASGLCQFLLESTSPGLFPRTPYRKHPPPGERVPPSVSAGLEEPRSA
jgi:hypothetical protein